MSSVVTIGFLDRTQTCLRAEFTPPIADDERRETLFHVALMTARAFAALPPDRQVNFAGMLKEWIVGGFSACPIRLVDGDPMACFPRFASSFLAPVCEYALAARGCDSDPGGVEYFLPMATVGFLRHVAATYHHPEEILKPALALCAAVVIQPLTVATHFQVAAASLPKVGAPLPHPPGDPLHQEEPTVARSSRSLRHTRWSLLVSACLAALAIVAGVQYCSTSVLP